MLRFNHLHPPFNNVAVRRAVMMAVNQDDYMASVTAGDASAYTVCKSMFPCGTPLRRRGRRGRDAGQYRQGAGRCSQASGYKGEKVVLISPTDLTTVGPFGDVTYDLLKKIGMNVEMVATDWGTVVQRRTSKEPVEKGGWSVMHTWRPSTIGYTPMEHSQIRGFGNTVLVRLVQGRRDGGHDPPLRRDHRPEGAGRNRAGGPEARLRPGALCADRHVSRSAKPTAKTSSAWWKAPRPISGTSAARDRPHREHPPNFHPSAGKRSLAGDRTLRSAGPDLQAAEQICLNWRAFVTFMRLKEGEIGQTIRDTDQVPLRAEAGI